MKKKSVLEIILIVIIILAFGLATIAYIKEKKETTNFYFATNCYTNITDNTLLQQEMEKLLEVSINDIYFINNGTINTDSKGNILKLNIEGIYKKDDQTYILKLEKNEDAYHLITFPDKNEEVGQVKLIEYLKAIAVWEFKSQDKVRFILNNMLTNGIKENDKYEQYLYENNTMTKIGEDKTGIYAKIAVFISNDNVSEIYFEK